MQQGTSTIARRPDRAAISTTPPPRDATPERPPNAAPQASRPTRSDATVPPESVRLTDCPESAEGRAYLIERELENDGYTALKALVNDYVIYARTHDRIPMATGLAHEGVRDEATGEAR
jgi:hypothetical protein